MRILLVGASGFIGSELARALLDDGHQLDALGRDLAYGQQIVPQAQWRHCDLRKMGTPADWAMLVADAEIVINASGALQTGLRDNVEQVQYRAIRALAEAANKAGVRHVIQISAAGADCQTASPFMASKARADAALAGAGVTYTVLRPGLVIGRNGFGGTELLRASAGFPLVDIEIAGTGTIQCVALSDIVDAMRRIIAEPGAHSGVYDLLERQGRPLADVIALHRRWLGLAAPRWRLRLPLALLKPATLVADLLGWLGWRSPLRSNSIAALVFGVRGNADQAARLLGREPLSLGETLHRLGAAGKADRWHARLAPVYPLALLALVALWLGSGLLGLTRSGAAASLLTEAGMDQSWARLWVILGSLADIAIALGLLFRPGLRLALGGSVFLALGYCLAAAFVRPDLWLDPLAPMLKVIPAMALSCACLAMADER